MSRPSPQKKEAFSGSLRQGRSKPNRFWERLLWLGALIFVIMIVTDIGYKEMRIRKLRQHIVEVEQQMNINRVEHQRLLLEREFCRTDAYIERMAREKLDWLRPGDIVFKVP